MSPRNGSKGEKKKKERKKKKVKPRNEEQLSLCFTIKARPELCIFFSPSSLINNVLFSPLVYLDILQKKKQTLESARRSGLRTRKRFANARFNQKRIAGNERTPRQRYRHVAPDSIEIKHVIRHQKPFPVQVRSMQMSVAVAVR